MCLVKKFTQDELIEMKEAIKNKFDVKQDNFPHVTSYNKENIGAWKCSKCEFTNVSLVVHTGRKIIQFCSMCGNEHIIE